MYDEKPDLIIKVCMFADNKVGKKLLTKKFLKSTFKESVGVNFYIKDVEIDGKLIRWQLWDWSLEEKKIAPYYLDGTLGVLLIYDITNVETLSSLTEWIKLIRRYTKEGTPILLVGNKLDLEENRDVSKDEVEKLKKTYNISSSMEISTKTGENLEEMFLKLTEMMYIQWKKSLNQ